MKLVKKTEVVKKLEEIVAFLTTVYTSQRKKGPLTCGLTDVRKHRNTIFLNIPNDY